MAGRNSTTVSSPSPVLAGVILAGGASRRMGGSKAFAMLEGRPLLQHVIDRFQPQVWPLVLSVERVSPALVGFGLRQVPDPFPGHRGPLGGLLGALRHHAETMRWLVTVPCDAPFLPVDLATRLHACAAAASARAAVVVHDGQIQPTFSIWHGELLSVIEKAVIEAGEGSLKQLLRAVGAAECQWVAAGGAEGPSPFLNVNDAEDLALAQRWAEHSAPLDTPCSA